MLPGSSREAGKLKWPLSSVTTETVMVAPSFLALTTTPSIGPSLADVTAPESAAAFCAKAGAELCSANAVRAAADASKIVFIRMEASLSGPGMAQSHAGPVQFIGIRSSVGPSSRRFNDTPAPQSRRQLAGGAPCVNNPPVLLNRHSVGMPR